MCTWHDHMHQECNAPKASCTSKQSLYSPAWECCQNCCWCSSLPNLKLMRIPLRMLFEHSSIYLWGWIWNYWLQTLAVSLWLPALVMCCKGIKLLILWLMPGVLTFHIKPQTKLHPPFTQEDGTHISRVRPTLPRSSQWCSESKCIQRVAFVLASPTHPFLMLRVHSSVLNEQCPYRCALLWKAEGLLWHRCVMARWHWLIVLYNTFRCSSFKQIQLCMHQIQYIGH